MELSSQSIKQEFFKIYQAEPEVLYFCPGRVNLIGEHLDYNGGLVLPAAINRGIYLAASKREQNTLRFYSEFDREIVEVNLTSIRENFDKQQGYVRYILAVLLCLPEFELSQGFDFYLCSDLPAGAGLSSSAALELVFACFLNPEMERNPDQLKQAVLACQRAENEFIGVKCGVMDQYAVAFGKKDFALLLDTNEVKHKEVPVELPKSLSLCILNSNKSRELENSAYNDRKNECIAALDFLHAKFQIQSLCEASMDMLPLLSAREDLEKRTRHVISENKRVSDAVSTLKAGDFPAFGQLLFESHYSLKTDFEVSCEELDTIENFAREFSPCLGCRMTGAGFGGSLVALIEKEYLSNFQKGVNEIYSERFGMSCDLFEVSPSNGVHRVL